MARGQEVQSRLGDDDMPQLYPTINLPTLGIPTRKQEKKYYPAPYFDFNRGDFLFDGAGRPIIADGRETFAQWIIKTCNTERGTRLAYSDKIGGEFLAAMKMPTIEAVKSAIIRTVTETCMVHPCTEWVKNFEFEVEGDELHVKFEVKGKDWADAISVTI